MNAGVLYISYTGLLEPLGQSQVLAYQERLASARPVHIISFERAEDLADGERVATLKARIERAGIHWHPRRYHKRPSALATLWDIVIGGCLGIRLAKRYRLGIVQGRSYVASVMALIVKGLTGAKFVFDMRGFWVDERVDGGLWRRDGNLYAIAKWFERRLLLGADHVVSLTHAAVGEMERFDYLQGCMPPVTVIPTCADLARFVFMDGHRAPRGFTLGYVGSAGTWYLFDATVAAFRYLQTLQPHAKFLIVNRNEHNLIRTKLHAGGLNLVNVEIQRADPEEIPQLMAKMDATVFFIKPVFSKQASAPTKLGEFLGCGIPVLSNAGVGDMAQILRQDRVGIAVDATDELSIRQGVSDLLALCDEPDIRQRCVDSARRHFSLEEGVARYAAIYRELADV